MDFFNSLLLALGKLIFGIGVLVSLVLSSFSTNVVVRYAPFPSPQTATPSTVASPAQADSAGAATTTSKIAAVPTLKQKTPAPVTQTPVVGQNVPSAPPPPATITDDTIAQVNAQTRPSVVNILCSFRTANASSYISGSGLVVDPRGVVLTNAHVAQFFLLQNNPGPDSASCTIRTGSPAAAAYTATLLYLPPIWITNNASQILSNQATGTGERDYAFLYITGPAQFAPPLPSSFPALSISTASPEQNDPVLLAGYPAGFLDATGVQRSLYISSAVSTIQQLYTFEDPHEVDLVSLGGTVVSQSGSSGGAVINLTNGKLVGLIATESEGTTTASRDLRAITLSYIDRNLQTDGEGGIVTLLSGDLLKTSQNFNTGVAPALIKQLVAAIDKQ